MAETEVEVVPNFIRGLYLKNSENDSAIPEDFLAQYIPGRTLVNRGETQNHLYRAAAPLL